MSRALTASDRSALIRLASTLPVGSVERKAILAGLSKTSSGEVNVPGKHILDNAEVFRNAKVFGNAEVYDNAEVFRNAYGYIQPDKQVKLLRGMGQRQDKFIGVTEEELLAELMQRRKN